ncbi:MAG: peptidylprolyl isomerase [Dehalococcoidaceae bacterium]|nr:peptidylprolyl isomerase [Dehalococcoidaceae bacterium]
MNFHIKRYYKYVALPVTLLLGLVLVTACKGEEAPMAQNGDTVKVHYTGTLEDGSVFDSSLGRDPLEFTLGEGSVIPGFESAVNGMKIGDSKTVTIPCEQAYGQRDDNQLIEIPKSQLPENLNPAVGQQLQMQTMEGQVLVVTVTRVDDESITVDANHPLAGKDLTFKIELVEIS